MRTRTIRTRSKDERWVNMEQDKRGEMGQCGLGQKVDRWVNRD